jgi:rod shape-determining protein MreC
MPGSPLSFPGSERHGGPREHRNSRRITDARIEPVGAARRGRLVLAGILLFCILLMSAQKPQGGSGRTLLEKGVLVAVSPLARGASAVADMGRAIVRQWQATLKARSENGALREELARQTREIFELRARADAAKRLAGMWVGARNLPRVVGVGAIVLLDTRGGFKHALIAAGSRDGVRVGSPLAVPDGLVGRVVSVGPHLAKAQLIVDVNSAVGVRVVGTDEQGVVRGDGTGELVLDYLPVLSAVRAGSRVETAGIDGIYPAGVLVGIVRSVRRGRGLFLEVKVQPTAEFNGLSDVLILTPGPAAGQGKP